MKWSRSDALRLREAEKRRGVFARHAESLNRVASSRGDLGGT